MKGHVFTIIFGVTIAGFSGDPPRTWKSQNGEYIVTVEYEGHYGEGNAHYTIKNKKRKPICNFTADVAPCQMNITNDGKRIIAFGGNWRDAAVCNKICFYDNTGKLLKKHSVAITVINDGAEKISGNNKYYVVGYQYLAKKQLALFDITTGELLWDLPVEVPPDEVGISGNGKWIVTIGELKTHWEKNKPISSEEKIILFDNTGKRHYEEIKEILLGERGGTLLIGDINDDGTEFELKEQKFKYNKTKDIWESNISKKFIYKNINGKVILEKTIEFEKNKK